MGTLLDKPETTKESKEEDGNGIRYGVCSMQGKVSTNYFKILKFH